MTTDRSTGPRRPGANRLFPVLALGATLAVPGGLQAQERTFVETLGSDTTSVETWTLDDDRLTGRYVIRPPVTQVVEYEGTIADDGSFETFMVRWTTPETNPEGPATRSARYTFREDSIVVEVEGPRSGRVAIEATDQLTLPFLQKLPVVYGLFDHVSRLATERGVDEMSYRDLPAGANQGFPNAFTRHPDGTVQVLDFGNPVLAEVDAEGRILSVDARRTTHKVLAEPAEDVSLDRLARRYAALDAEGRGMGSASSRDTVEVTSAGADFWIDYGRPSTRGREIWGELVPFGEVWRTGADAATQFRTSRDLVIGGEELPAGTYTLWTVPSDTGMTLIVNEQTGQWGTQHDPSKDLLEVEMERQLLRTPVERLTLDIEPTADGGELVLSWDRARFSVPIEVR